MKKRILGLALALIMIISLLPLTAFAEGATTIKVVFRDAHIAAQRVDVSFINGSQYASQTKEYITFEDVLDTDGVTPLGNKPVFSETAPAEGTPHIFIQYENYVLTMTFNNVNYIVVGVRCICHINLICSNSFAGFTHILNFTKVICCNKKFIDV